MSADFPPSGRIARLAIFATQLLAGIAATAQPIQVPARFQPPGSWSDLVAVVEPAVVSIQAVSLVVEHEPPAADEAPIAPESPDGDSTDPYEFFFGDSPDGGNRERREDAGGSGFVVSADGLIITNHHVVEGASRIVVRLGERDYPARLRGVDPATDLALLAIDAGRALPYLELADSDAVAVGDPVLVIGNPLNLDHTVTTGVVSALGRSIGIQDASFEAFIQTDAAINFGNSGGPLVDTRGRVMGVATAINFGANNVGFAVPANIVRDVLPQLRDHGEVVRGALGVPVRNLDATLAAAFGAPDTEGALILEVPKRSAGAAAGLAHGDIVVAIDDRPVKATRDLIGYVASRTPGTKVTLDVLRDGKPTRLEATLGTRAPAVVAIAAPPPVPEPEVEPGPGIVVAAMNVRLRKEYELPVDAKGLVVTKIAPSSPLYDQNVRPGTVLAEINGRAVATARDFESAWADAAPGSWLRLYLFRFEEDGSPTPFFAALQAPGP